MNGLKKKEVLEKAFSNWQNGGIHFTWPNGNWLSTTFAPGTYSDNHHPRWPMGNEFVKMESNTCEIMFECPDKLRNRIMKKYDGDTGNSVIGYLTIQQWTEIINLLSK